MTEHGQEARWWQTRGFAVLAIVAAALPLLWPAIPPLTDVPGHIGLYRILVDGGAPPLVHHYAVAWAPVGNLGLELLVAALHPLLDVEPATRLIVMLIPALTVAAMLWLARVAHGRMPPASGFALPLAYALPLQLGFVNFTLAAALALGALALWIRLASRPGVRLMLFVPIAGAVWLCHSFGWAMLGLFAFGVEITILRSRGMRLGPALLRAALACAPMAWPQLLASVAGPQPAGNTGDWFNWTSKAQWAASLLRERWKAYDVACAALLVMLLWWGVRSSRVSFVSVLGMPAALGLAAFLVVPRLFAGGAYVDMRLLPYAVALGLLAIRTAPGETRLESRLAAAGVAFFVMRTTTSTIALALFAQAQQAELAAIPHLPPGSSVLTLVNEPSPAWWDNPRLSHVAGIAIARRQVFTNEPWAIKGQQIVQPLHPRAAPYDRDPSQAVYPPGAPYAGTDFDTAIRGFDRGSFGYVWTIGFPLGRVHAADLVPVWWSGRSALYRVTLRRNTRLSSDPSRP